MFLKMRVDKIKLVYRRLCVAEDFTFKAKPNVPHDRADKIKRVYKRLCAAEDSIFKAKLYVPQNQSRQNKARLQNRMCRSRVTEENESTRRSMLSLNNSQVLHYTEQTIACRLEKRNRDGQPTVSLLTPAVLCML